MQKNHLLRKDCYEHGAESIKKVLIVDVQKDFLKNNIVNMEGKLVKIIEINQEMKRLKQRIRQIKEYRKSKIK